MYSPFGNDFGNNQDGLLLQDCTGEQDIFLTEFLDEVFNIHDDSCEESTSHKESAIGSEIHALTAGHSYSKDTGPSSDSNTEMAQIQVQNNPVWPSLF